MKEENIVLSQAEVVNYWIQLTWQILYRGRLPGPLIVSGFFTKITFKVQIKLQNDIPWSFKITTNAFYIIWVAVLYITLYSVTTAYSFPSMGIIVIYIYHQQGQHCKEQDDFNYSCFCLYFKETLMNSLHININCNIKMLSHFSFLNYA